MEILKSCEKVVDEYEIYAIILIVLFKLPKQL